MSVTKDFEDLFGYLNKYHVKAIVVGAHAVAFHAKPRYTKDVDVLIERTSDNAARLLEALRAFGFGELGLSVTDFTEPEQVIQLGVAPNRVDFLTSIRGVTFEEAWSTKVRGRYGKLNVFYLGKKELIRAKRAAGRPQDLMDLSWLSDES